MPQAFIAQTSVAESLSRAYAGMVASTAPWHKAHGLHTSRQNQTVTPSAANSTAYTLSITSGGVTTNYTYTSDADATVAEITAGLTALINAGTQPVTATDNTTSMSLVADYYTSEYGFTVTSTGAGTLTIASVQAQNASLPDGFFCVFDSSVSSDPMAVRVPTSSGDVTGVVAAAGISVANPLASVRLGNYALAPQMVTLMRKGHIVVAVEEAVTANSAVYVRYAAGGNGRGAFGAGAGTSERALLNGAVYRSASFALPGGGLGAVVEINIVGG